MRRPPAPRILLLAALVAFACLAAGPVGPRPAEPLARAHAHNDYRHGRPLLDALDHGFCSVEADVFLVDGELLVGHERSELRPGRSLESLYLAPLRDRVQANGGRVHRGGPPLWLLVDIKSEAGPAYAALDSLLARHADLFSTVRDDAFEPGAVTVVVSGNRAADAIRGQAVRRVAIDGRPEDLRGDAPAHLVPWVSANWTKLFGWRGEGPMPEAERAKLRDHVRGAHGRGRLVRFWATPEDPAVWRELTAAGVDLIGTDDLPKLRRFLRGGGEGE